MKEETLVKANRLKNEIFKADDIANILQDYLDGNTDTSWNPVISVRYPNNLSHRTIELSDDMCECIKEALHKYIMKCNKEFENL